MIRNGFRAYFLGLIVLTLGPNNASGDADRPRELSDLDEEAVLTRVDEYLGEQAFAEVFRIGDQSTVTSKSCISGTFCSSYDFRIRVADVLSDKVVLMTQAGSSGETREEILRNEWEAARGNRIRIELSRVKSYGFQVTFTAVAEVSCAWLERGTHRSGQCLRVQTQIVNGIRQKGTLELEVNRQGRGLGQLHRRSQRLVGLEERTVRELSINF